MKSLINVIEGIFDVGDVGEVTSKHLTDNLLLNIADMRGQTRDAFLSRFNASIKGDTIHLSTSPKDEVAVRLTNDGCKDYFTTYPKLELTSMFARVEQSSWTNSNMFSYIKAPLIETEATTIQNVKMAAQKLQLGYKMRIGRDFNDGKPLDINFQNVDTTTTKDLVWYGYAGSKMSGLKCKFDSVTLFLVNHQTSDRVLSRFMAPVETKAITKSNSYEESMRFSRQIGVLISDICNKKHLYKNVPYEVFGSLTGMLGLNCQPKFILFVAPRKKEVNIMAFKDLNDIPMYFMPTIRAYFRQYMNFEGSAYRFGITRYKQILPKTADGYYIFIS